jgi:hypothetical protein
LERGGPCTLRSRPTQPLLHFLTLRGCHGQTLSLVTVCGHVHVTVRLCRAGRWTLDVDVDVDAALAAWRGTAVCRAIRRA